MAQLDFLQPVAESNSVQKAPGAYQTISEVSDNLGVPQHVLRFWESNFSQIKPSRLRGGRRYYSPEDVQLLHKIKTMLYTQGLTIKGAKKFLKSKVDPESQDVIKSAVVVQEASSVTNNVSTASSIDRQKLIAELRVMKNLLDAARS